MWELAKKYLLYPSASFAFEFLGDRPWLIAIIVLLIAILIWRFCMPVLIGFYKLFGWQGYALIALSFATIGVFGAGWRAHRDASLTPGTPEYHGNDGPTIAAPKRKRVSANDPDAPEYSGLDGALQQVFAPGKRKKKPATR